jgi:hypothetical protein
MKRLIIFVVCAALLSGCTLWLRQSHEGIRTSVLKATPLGSTPVFVQEVAQTKGWKIDAVNMNRGFWRDGKNGSTGSGFVVGVASIHASLGEFHEIPVPFVTSVEAYWGFDAGGHLIDVYIRSSTDGI